MSAPEFTINDSVLTPDGTLGRIGEFDEGGDKRIMAKVNFGDGQHRWYDVNRLTYAL
jgi:hypothetical protein